MNGSFPMGMASGNGRVSGVIEENLTPFPNVEQRRPICLDEVVTCEHVRRWSRGDHSP